MNKSLPTNSIFLAVFAIFLIPSIALGQTIYRFGVDSSKSYIPHSLIKTSDGNYIISGEGYNVNMNIENYPSYHYVVKFKPNGDTVWTGLYDLDWYAEGHFVETNNNYQIVYTGDGPFSCNGGGLNFPFREIKSRTLDFNGKELGVNEISNSDCSNSIMHHERDNDSYFFLTRHSDDNFQNKRVALTELNVNGSHSSIGLDIADDNRYSSFISTDSIIIVGPTNITHFTRNGSLIQTYNFDSIRYEKSVRTFFTNGKDSIINFYCSYDFSGRRAVIRSMDLEGNLGKETLIKGFRYHNVIQDAQGNFLLAGQNRDNHMSVLVLNSNLDSVTTKVYEQELSSYGADIVNLDNGKFMLVGWISDHGVPSPYLVVIDSVQVSTGIDVKSKELFSQLKVYPNPSKGVFSIETGTVNGPIDLTVLDASGRKVYGTTFEKRGSLQLEFLEDGIYHLHLNSGQHSVNQKLVISRYECIEKYRGIFCTPRCSSDLLQNRIFFSFQ